MLYRKFQAEKIFNGSEFLRDHVLIAAQDGRIEDIVRSSEAGNEVEKLEGLIVPGLINCHCHLELSHMKGRIPENTGLVDFVFKVVTERYFSEDEILAAIKKAEDEMLQNGIVAVGDICNNISTLSQKQKARLHYYNFIEASGWLPSVSQIRFEKVKAIYDEFSSVKASFENHQLNGQLSNLNCSIVPHAPYSVSEKLWQEIQPFFKGKTVSIHNQETFFEDDFFMKGTGDFHRMYELMKIDNTHHLPTGKTSLQSYFHKLKSAENIILVHNTFTKQEDIQYVLSARFEDKKYALTTTAHQPSTFFCLCINANQYIEKALPPVELLRKNNCRIVLGTDSLASNWSLNIMDEIKTIQKNFPSLGLEEILKWATINGAEALGLADQLGSFEKGKQPGIVNIVEAGDDFIIKRIL